MEFLFFLNKFQKSNMNNYIETKKFLRKLIVSTPLISLAFNGIH